MTWSKKYENREWVTSALNSAKALRLKDDYYRLQENSDMQELNKLLEFDWTNGIVKFETLKKYGKRPYPTKNKRKEQRNPLIGKGLAVLYAFLVFNPERETFHAYSVHKNLLTLIGRYDMLER